LYRETSLSLDGALVKEYFPVSVVLPAILEIYQNLFGVRFHEIKDSQTWHPDAQVFAIWVADAKDESDFVGYCYFDLFQRGTSPFFVYQRPSAELTARLESKCGHAVGWPLLPGYLCSDGKFRIAHMLAVVASLAKPTPDRPALMYHEDAVSFFHEMRHVFHGFLSRTYFSLFHETSFAHDFVEAPSQMLENWYAS
jgi:Zn-dependent oligopeptidase